jgi:hypothetical protein
MIPRPVLIADLVTDTTYAERRNRFYFAADTAPTGITPLENICNFIMNKYSPLLSQFLTTQSRIVRVEGQWMGSGSTGFEANSTVAAVPGVHTAVTPGAVSEDEASTITDTLPDEVSLIIQKRTGNTNRGSMGRWFFTGLTEKMQNHGVIARDYLTSVVSLANQFSDDITVTGSGATILHARHWNRKANSLQPITKCYALKVLGTRLDRRNPLRLTRV